MKKAITAAIGLILLLLLVGCSANWHAKQAQKHIKKAKMKDPDISFIDTIYQTVIVEIPKVRVDTVFSKEVDTLEVVKERLRIRYIRTTDSVYLSGECDSIIVEKEVPVTINEKVFIERMPAWWRRWGKWVAIGVGVLLIASIILKIIKPL